jgi:hypothetical protein
LGLPVEVRIVQSDLTEGEAFALEIERIAFWRADGADLANRTIGGEGPAGHVHTEEHKRAIGDKLKGRPKTAEHIAKVADAQRGRPKRSGWKKSAEAVERTAAASRGKPKSAETRAKISAAKIANPSLKVSVKNPEWLAKIGAAQRGRPKSEETKARMRKPKSEEHKEKLRLANLGKTATDETRRLLSEKAKADWARRKAMSKVEGE